MSNNLSLLKELVDTNSGTRNRAGVLAVQKKLAPLLERAGFTLEWVENPEGKSGAALVASFGVTANAKVVTLVGHADTVFESDHPFQKFAGGIDGKTATGPGIIDDKGSLVVGLEGVKRFLEQGRFSGLGLRFVVSPNEEIGSPGFHGYFQELSKRSDLVVGLEPALDNGDIVTQRKGGRWYKIEVEGREAHAGRAHQSGVNAGHELAIKLDKLQRLTNYPQGLTVNIGSFEGGNQKFNIVCGHATGRIDIRYEKAKAGASLFKKIEAILKTKFVGKGSARAKTTWSIEDTCPPLENRKENTAWVREYAKLVGKLEGRKPKAGFSGGGSDSSHFGRPGLVVLDGLGATGGKIHTTDEFLVVSSLETRSAALAELLRYAAARFQS